MELIDHDLKLRPFEKTDSAVLADLCNNRKIWNNLRDYIPSPYTEEDARAFIFQCRQESPQYTFVIEYRGKFVGSIGLVRQADVYKMNAEIGYWLGEPYWKQGIATRAVRLMTDYGFTRLELVRIFAGVFAFNRGSQRVLEKAGYALECIVENAIVKNGMLCDEYRYGFLNRNGDVKVK
jgi:RimJ/RimL family protein N-acetyltransferase